MAINKNTLSILYCFLVILAIFFTTIHYAPYLIHGGPIGDQPHYLFTSLNIWNSGDWFFLRVETGPYIAKPPMQFWLTNILWHIFGLKNYVFRLIPTLSAIFLAFIMKGIFAELFPSYKEKSYVAALCFISVFYFLSLLPLYGQDLLLLTSIAFSIYATLIAKKHFFGFIMLWFGLAFGLLTKGPVIFIFTMIPALTLPFFIDIKYKKASWFIILLFVVILSTFPILYWLYLVLSKSWINMSIYFKEALSVYSGTKQVTHHTSYWSRVMYYIIYPAYLFPLCMWPYLYTAAFQELKKQHKDRKLKWMLLNIILIWLIMLLIPSRAARYILPLNIFLILFFSYCLIIHSEKFLVIKNKLLYSLCFVFFLAALGLSLFGQALLVKLFGTHLNTTALIALNLMGIILSGYYCLKPITTLHGYLVRQLTLSAMLVGVYILSSVSAYQKNVTQLYAYLQQTSQNHPLAYVLKPDGLYYFFSVGYGAPSINQTFLTDDSQIAPWKQQHPTGFLVNSYSVKPKNMNNILYYTQVKTAEFITVEK